MIGVNEVISCGEVRAYTTSGRGLTVEEIADLSMRRVLNIADSAPPAIRDQANAFKEDIRLLLIQSMNQAIKSNKTTLYNQLKNQGFDEVAELILKL